MDYREYLRRPIPEDSRPTQEMSRRESAIELDSANRRSDTCRPDRGSGAGIVNLDPVIIVTLRVSQRAAIARHKFIDNQYGVADGRKKKGQNQCGTHAIASL